jgi:hypothetical protein
MDGRARCQDKRKISGLVAGRNADRQVALSAIEASQIGGDVICRFGRYDD